MKSCPKFHVKKRTLLAIAGTVWIIAGVNVARLGIIDYILMDKISVIHLLLSFLVFVAFSSMFHKMSIKHDKRIRGYEEFTRSFWHFFDLKAYSIMIFMITGGLWLRSSGLVPIVGIAVFYTGLGLALAAAGVFFWRMYFIYPTQEQ